LGESGEADVAWFDAEPAEAAAERGDADVTVGPSGGEQPAGGELVDGAGEAAVRESAGEPVEGLGELEWVAGELDGGCAVSAVVDVAGAEGDDAGERLGVEHDEGSGDAVVGSDGVVDHETAGQLPAVFDVDRGAHCRLAAGIDTVARTDHAGYLAHWTRMLHAQPSILWTVASKAQAATDWLAAYTLTPAELAAV
jgi:hypothetical protein